MRRKRQPAFESEAIEELELNPELSESGDELNEEVLDTLRNYASPFFNWISKARSAFSGSPGIPSAPPYSYTPTPVVSATSGSITETQKVQMAIANGQRDENVLTNMVFNGRHPELGGKPLTKSLPNFSSLSQEWVSIRNTIVRPALGSLPSLVTSTPASSGGFVPLPASGPGFRRKENHPNDKRQYGVPQAIQALIAIGAKWSQSHPSGPRIQIGDISFQDGSKMDPHSTHRNGLNTDIRPVRNDGKELPVSWNTGKNSRNYNPAYSIALTQELVNTIYNNGVLGVSGIYFNDPKITGVKPLKGHDDHLHVMFKQPGISTFEVQNEWEAEYELLSEFTFEAPAAAPAVRTFVDPRKVTCAKTNRTYPIFRAIGTKDPVGSLEAICRRAVEMMTNTISELTRVKDRVSAGDPIGFPLLGDLFAWSLEHRMKMNVNDRAAWTGTGPRNAGIIIRWLTRIRELIAGRELWFTCLESAGCNSTTWAWVFTNNAANRAAGRNMHRIHLCRRFWQPKPGVSAATHFEFQAQTIIHEASHIYYDTEDQGRGPGAAECISQFIAEANNSPLDPDFIKRCGGPSPS